MSFRTVFPIFFLASVASSVYAEPLQPISPSDTERQQQLGEALFHDPTLSRDGQQSCSSCHNPEHAFIDTRSNASSLADGQVGAVSTGQDGHSLGDINTPTITYAAFIPAFHFDPEEQLFKGGLFLNGRAATLHEQAIQPMLNPVEMQNTKEGVVAAVKERYSEQMKTLYGEDIFEDTEKALEGIATSLAAFERSSAFSSFDSKFDRVLEGKEKLTEQEQWGLDLFKNEAKGNCAACHPVPDLNSEPADKLFTDFSYDNLGVPKHQKVHQLTAKAEQTIDPGLLGNPAVADNSLEGAFRVTTLRNIAVTAPYMHNGVFRDLETVVHFYNSRDVAGALNPETGAPWQAAEVARTKNTEELGDLGLSNNEVKAVVAFLKTLTDKRYEGLMVEEQ